MPKRRVNGDGNGLQVDGDENGLVVEGDAAVLLNGGMKEHLDWSGS
mgnify:CR=1 FL=1